MPQDGEAAADPAVASPLLHSLRCTKAVLIYRRTGNLRAVQLLLEHTKIESAVRYLVIEVDDEIEIAGEDAIRRIADMVGDNGLTAMNVSPLP